jgi:hypothetical protein
MRFHAAIIAITIAAVSASGARSAEAQPAHLRPGQFVAGPREDTAPFVDLLTFGVGEVIFEKFGHAAICLRYHNPKLTPVCFNYGVTDFAAGTALVWGFLRGTQEFWVEPSTYASMYGFYKWEDRDIWVQRLPFTQAEARAMEREVWSSLEAGNRTYTYDHFFDNCTTRLRDMIDRVTGGKLSASSDAPYPLTFRDLGRRGLAELPSLLALTDFVVGRQLEDHPTVWQAMFHPDIFRAEVERRLAAKPQLISQRRGYAFRTSGSSGRLEMFAIALVFALPLLAARARRSPRLRYTIDAAFALALGFVLWRIASLGATVVVGAAIAACIPMVLANVLRTRGELAGLVWATLYLTLWGLIIWSLVVLSSIPGVRWNEVVFVLIPFDVVLPFLGAARRRRYARFRLAGLLLVSLLAAIGVFVQPLWLPILTAFLPHAIVALDLPLGWPEDGAPAAVPS